MNQYLTIIFIQKKQLEASSDLQHLQPKILVTVVKFTEILL